MSITNQEVGQWIIQIIETRRQAENKFYYAELTGKIELLQWLMNELSAREAVQQAAEAATEAEEAPNGGDLAQDSAESPPAEEGEGQ